LLLAAMVRLSLTFLYPVKQSVQPGIVQFGDFPKGVGPFHDTLPDSVGNLLGKNH